MNQLIIKGIKRVLDKVLSARYIITVALTFTFCYLAVKKEVEVAAFTAIFGIVIRDYFERSDRRKKKDEESNGNGSNGGNP